MKKLTRYVLVIMLNNHMLKPAIVPGSTTPKPALTAVAKPAATAIAKAAAPTTVVSPTMPKPAVAKPSAPTPAKPITSKPTLVAAKAVTPIVAKPAASTVVAKPSAPAKPAVTTTALTIPIGYPFTIKNSSAQSITITSFTFEYTTSDKPGVTQKINVAKTVTLSKKAKAITFNSLSVLATGANASGTFSGLSAITLNNNQIISLSQPSMGLHTIYITNTNDTWSASETKPTKTTRSSKSKNATIKAAAAGKIAKNNTLLKSSEKSA